MYYPVVEECMRAAKKTVLDVAREVGVPKTTLYAKLGGKSDISINLAIGIRKAVGATDKSIEELFATAGPAA